MKTNSDFRLSKSTKRMLALSKFKSPEQRTAWKKAMIQAELSDKAARSIKIREPKGDNE